VLSYLRLLIRVLDTRAKLRLGLAGVAAVLLAGIEALGLLLVAPLVLLVNAAATAEHSIPSGAQWFTDLLRADSPGEAAFRLGFLIFLVFVFKGLLSLALLRKNIQIVMESEAEMSRRLFRAYLHAPWSFHLRRNSADLQRTVHESVRRVYQDAMATTSAALGDSLVIVAVTLVLFVVEPVVAVAASAYFGVVGLGYQRLVHRRIEQVGAGVHEDWERAFRLVQENLRSAKLLALLHRQDQAVEQLHEAKLAMANRMGLLILLFQLPRYYLEVALLLGVAVISAALFTLRPADEALAGLGIFLVAGFRLLPSLNRVLNAASAASAALPPLRQIASDLAGLEPIVTAGDSRPLDRPPLIELEEVTFTYEDGSRPAINRVSVAVPPGATVALVGGSGAGKTTLVDILLGLLEPDSGVVTIHGEPLSAMRDRYQRSIGYVPQDVTLTDDTLAANITFGHGAIDEGRLRQVVRAAQLDDLVASSPAGLESRVGEHGLRVSGGQRQRIGLARALYHDPVVLVLDEATSGLDSATEARILDTIEGLRGKLTIVIIAHRLSTVRRADTIYFLREGRLAGTGSFEHLSRTCPDFAELVRLAEVDTTR
jgi:ABC-type multidrug transport system fused ATPase/permease subunit